MKKRKVKDDDGFFIACPRHKNRALRHLAFCFAACEKKCTTFQEVPHQTIVRMIEADKGKHAIDYRQYRLF